ncbi:MAG: methyltransferase domain-containing protein [Deltaproteobacteria bacterium]|nr:methyltransferase domain-containing protein [Deltaproteobacteria bacterium]
MRINTNTWNRIRYSLYAPFYDLAARWFAAQRRRSIELLDLKSEERVLIVGAGTGLDLEFLPNDISIEANDITSAMVQQLARRANRLGLKVKAEVMDGQNLQYDPESFDAVILHLVLAIIPDPIRCIQEVERVLKKEGRAVIFDKFLPDNQKPSWGRKLLNLFTNVIATNITRQLGPILDSTTLKIVYEEPAGFGGFIKIVLVRK